MFLSLPQTLDRNKPLVFCLKQKLRLEFAATTYYLLAPEAWQPLLPTFLTFLQITLY